MTDLHSERQGWLYVAADGDNIGDAVADAIFDEAGEDRAKELSQLILEAQRNIREGVELAGGEVVFEGGDNILYSIDESKLRADAANSAYFALLGTTATTGIGKTAAEAAKAMLIGKECGKGVIIFWTEDLSKLWDEVVARNKTMKDFGRDLEQKFPISLPNSEGAWKEVVSQISTNRPLKLGDDYAVRASIWAKFSSELAEYGADCLEDVGIVQGQNPTILVKSQRIPLWASSKMIKHGNSVSSSYSKFVESARLSSALGSCRRIKVDGAEMLCFIEPSAAFLVRNHFKAKMASPTEIIVDKQIEEALADKGAVFAEDGMLEGPSVSAEARSAFEFYSLARAALIRSNEEVNYGQAKSLLLTASRVATSDFDRRAANALDTVRWIVDLISPFTWLFIQDARLKTAYNLLTEYLKDLRRTASALESQPMAVDIKENCKQAHTIYGDDLTSDQAALAAGLEDQPLERTAAPKKTVKKTDKYPLGKRPSTPKSKPTTKTVTKKPSPITKKMKGPTLWPPKDMSLVPLRLLQDHGYVEVLWIKNATAIDSPCLALDGRRWEIGDFISDTLYDAPIFSKTHVGCHCSIKVTGPDLEDTVLDSGG